MYLSFEEKERKTVLLLQNICRDLPNLEKLLTEEDFIAALGDVDETGVLTAKKVILQHSLNTEQKTYLWGQVLTNAGKLTTIKDKDSKTQSISIDDSTVFKPSDFVLFL